MIALLQSELRVSAINSTRVGMFRSGSARMRETLSLVRDTGTVSRPRRLAVESAIDRPIFFEHLENGDRRHYAGSAFTRHGRSENRIACRGRTLQPSKIYGDCRTAAIGRLCRSQYWGDQVEWRLDACSWQGVERGRPCTTLSSERQSW
jgi:hypothetical protein